MARPLKKGPPIAFRLPVDMHAALVERAEAHGETVVEYVERNITRALAIAACDPDASASLRSAMTEPVVHGKRADVAPIPKASKR